MNNTILPFHLGFQSERIQLFIPAYRAQISTPAGVPQTGISFPHFLWLNHREIGVKKAQSSTEFNLCPIKKWLRNEISYTMAGAAGKNRLRHF